MTREAGMPASLHLGAFEKRRRPAARGLMEIEGMFSSTGRWAL